MIQTIKISKLFNVSNILKKLKLGNFWRYKIKTKESQIKSLQMAVLIYLVLHVGGCIFSFIGMNESL